MAGTVVVVVGYPFDVPKLPGPWVHPTEGSIWPQPLNQTSSSVFMILRPNHFLFQIGRWHRCDIIDEAVSRYHQVIFSPARGKETARRFQKEGEALHQKWKEMDQFGGYLDAVSVQLQRPCQKYPSIESDESYEIVVNCADLLCHGSIFSPSVWGILHGLESFSQLVYSSQDGAAFQMNVTRVVDGPRFAHRGLMLDSSRHFLPVNVIKDQLDLMAHNKLNVFHWHLTDDQSFPYQSVTFPALSELGAYSRYSRVYTPSNVQDVVEYARLRGIRVIPEFDTPGHTASWGPGVADLLTQCYDESGAAEPFFGPINPVADKNYKFLRTFFQEVNQVFPDAYAHLGGDEVDFTCWASNAEIVDFMATQDWGQQFEKLEEYYMQRLIKETREATNGTMKFLIWQEVIDNGVSVPSDTIVHVWKDGFHFAQEMQRVTGYGYRTLLSSPWYLNRISYGIDWDQYYVVEPLSFNGTDAQKELVIGGEACMWTEFVDEVGIIGRTWPRASAVAERLWSDRSVDDARAAAPRLQEHRCRLLRRGYPVDPINGPSFCDVE